MTKYELVVLGFLSDGPIHGYQINRNVKTHCMGSWANISFAMVYKTLTKLEESEMVRKVKVERAGLMPERRIYRLTSKGKKRLASLVEKSLTDENLTSDLSDLGYFFIHALPNKDALECLNERKAFMEKIIKNLQERQAALVEEEPINRTVSIEKSLDRFKSELSHLKRLVKQMGWRLPSR